jgi:hypothetical protein
MYIGNSSRGARSHRRDLCRQKPHTGDEGLPAIRDDAVRDRRAVHHVCVCATSAWYQGGILRLRERPVWGLWECSGCQQRVSFFFGGRKTITGRLGFRRAHHQIWCSMCRINHPRHPAYKAWSGFAREEAIMVLRRFYITENVNGTHFTIHVRVFMSLHNRVLAPAPKSKANRLLKTEIPPEKKPPT